MVAGADAGARPGRRSGHCCPDRAELPFPGATIPARSWRRPQHGARLEGGDQVAGGRARAVQANSLRHIISQPRTERTLGV